MTPDPSYTVTFNVYVPTPQRATVAIGGVDTSDDLDELLADVYDPAAKREVHKAVIALQCVLYEALTGRPVSEWADPQQRDPTGYWAIVNS